MADSFHVGIDDVKPVPGLGPDQGWVGMTVEAVMIWGWAGAASREQAGYELRYPRK